MTMRHIAVILGALFALAICVAAYVLLIKVPITSYPVPPRSDAAATVPDEKSVIVAPVSIPLSDIRRQLENDVPRQLWSINRRLEECVPRKQVRVLGQNITRTPKVSCTIVGNVRRGRITLGGSGNMLVARFPISATIRAEDIGGIIKRETATGSATVELRARLSVNRDWRARANVDLSYRWRKEPGIDFLGQRIRFTDRANSELRPIIATIEKSLERQIGRTDVRSQVADVWSQAFSVESLNAQNPPVWMRIEPQQVGMGAFRVSRGRITTDAMVVADTRIVVGERPEAPASTPLGQNASVDTPPGFNATIPVFADYAQLEPVILRALRKLADRGVEYENLGRLDVEFESVRLYATGEGRIAVGVSARVKPIGQRTGGIWSETSGEIWLTATPVTQSDSQVLRVENLKIFGDMDRTTGDLLVRLISGPEMTVEIEKALVEDFKKDYDEVIEKARVGASSIQLKGIELRFDIADIEHGPVQATGDGLYMPVRASGSVRVRLD